MASLLIHITCFGSKDFDVRNGMSIYDSNARTYTTDIARFMQPDPKAHDYHRLSPYAYCGGDPINNIDSEGRNIFEFNEIYPYFENFEVFRVKSLRIDRYNKDSQSIDFEPNPK